MIHLICGPPGAGKTTLAHSIVQKTGAVHLSIDHCLKGLSFPESPDWIFLQRIFEKAQAEVVTLLKQAEAFVAQNRDVVLDLGAFTRAQRDNIRAWARGTQSEFILHYLIASTATRRNRVIRRNEEKGEAYAFRVPVWLFDLVEGQFEPPTDDEHPIVVDTETNGAR